MTASGQRFSAALRSMAKSSSVIFTFTWTVRFIPPVSKDFYCSATLLGVLLVPSIAFLVPEESAESASARRHWWR